MNLHYYDPVTRMYTHTVPAMENPRRKGSYFEQPFSTTDPLPVLGNQQAAVRNSENTQWMVVQDYRGIAWDTTSKEKVIIDTIGPLPSGITTIEPGAFDRWDGNKWVLDKAAKNAATASDNRRSGKRSLLQALSKPISYDGALFDYDQTGKQAILETIEEAAILGVDDSESTGWRLADNSVRQTTVADLKDIVRLGAVRRRQLNAQYTAWTQTDMQTAFELLES